MKNPFEGKEIRMQKGIVFEPHCNSCGNPSQGFHVSSDGKPPSEEVKGACCSECGSLDLIWEVEGFSGGDVLK